MKKERLLDLYATRSLGSEDVGRPMPKHKPVISKHCCGREWSAILSRSGDYQNQKPNLGLPQRTCKPSKDRSKQNSLHPLCIVLRMTRAKTTLELGALDLVIDDLSWHKYDKR